MIFGETYVKQVAVKYGIPNILNEAYDTDLLYTISEQSDVPVEQLGYHICGFNKETITMLKADKSNKVVELIKVIKGISSLVNHALATGSYQKIKSIQSKLFGQANSDISIENFLNDLISTKSLIISKQNTNPLLLEDGTLVLPDWCCKNYLQPILVFIKLICSGTNYKPTLLSMVIKNPNIISEDILYSKNNKDLISFAIMSELIETNMGSLIHIPIDPDVLIRYNCVSYGLKNGNRALVYWDKAANQYYVDTFSLPTLLALLEEDEFASINIRNNHIHFGNKALFMKG